MTRRDETKNRFFTTYNLTDRQQHAQDILTIVKAIRVNKDLSQNISLHATGNTGITGLLVASMTKDLSKIALDGDNFDPSTDENMLKMQVPGILRMGGLKTVLALASDKNLMIYNANSALMYPQLAEVSRIANNKNFSVATGNTGSAKAIEFLKN